MAQRRDDLRAPCRGIDPSGGLILSAFVHLLGFTLVAFALSRKPHPGAAGSVTRDQLVTMQRLLAASDARDVRGPRAERHAVERLARREPPSDPIPPRASRIEPPAIDALPPSEAPALPVAEAASGRAATRAAEKVEAASLGMVGLARALRIDPGEPTPWKDALAALDGHADEIHSLFDAPPPQTWGIGGLVLSGTGEGVGGKGQGVDLGEPTAPGPVPYHPLPGRGTRVSDSIRGELAHVVASIAENTMKRVVLANAMRFHQCYAAGLRRDPALAGRVVVAFTLDEHGDVTVARDDGSDLPDQAVRACIVARFFSLHFAPPKSGTLSGKYPFALAPDE